MKKLIILPLIIYSVLGFCSTAENTENFGIFLNKNVKTHCSDQKTNYSIFVQMPAAWSSLTYTGKKRKISKEKMKFLEYFSKTISQPLINDYEHELELKGLFHTFWIPIQKATLKSYEKVSATERNLTTKIRFLGCYRLDKNTNPVAVMTYLYSSE